MAYQPKRIRKRVNASLTTKNCSETFQSSLKDFKDYYKNVVSSGTINDLGWAWKQLGPHFGHIRLSEVAPEDVERYKTKRLSDGVKKRTVNRELSYISTIIKWAESMRMIDPLAFRIQRFRKRETRGEEPTVHTPKEVNAIIRNLKPRHRGLVLLMYDAGLRKSEAMNLCGDHVDLDFEQIRVRGKGNKIRIVPIMTKRLLAALTSAKLERGKACLFPNPYSKEPYKDISQALRTASKRAGVDKKIYHHLLRHDHGTHTALAGVDSRAIQRILGHSSLSTTEIYTHLAGDYLRSEGKKFAELLEEEAGVTTCSQ